MSINIIILGLQMKNLLICLLILLYNDASGVCTDDVSACVMEGDSVNLNTDVKTNQQEEVVWYFNDIRIAQISGDLSKICTDVQCKDGDERFRDRLKLDNQTGSLTIMNISTTDSGDYKLVIISSSSSNSKISRVAVHGVPAAQRDQKKTKSVLEGESVTLDLGVTKNPNDSMTWYFNDTLIAVITGDQSKICTDIHCSDRFQDRLKLVHQTGSLTITNTRTTDSGLYTLQISSSSSSSSSIRRRRHSIGVTSLKRFSISVTAVPDSGLSPAAVAGICGVLLLVVCAVAGALAKRKGICMQQNNQNTNGTSPSLTEAAEDTSLSTHLGGQVSISLLPKTLP